MAGFIYFFETDRACTHVTVNGSRVKSSLNYLLLSEMARNNDPHHQLRKEKCAISALKWSAFKILLRWISKFYNVDSNQICVGDAQRSVRNV